MRVACVSDSDGAWDTRQSTCVTSYIDPVPIRGGMIYNNQASKSKIKDLQDVKGFDALKQEDQEMIETLVGEEQDFQAELVRVE